MAGMSHLCHAHYQITSFTGYPREWALHCEVETGVKLTIANSGYSLRRNQRKSKGLFMLFRYTELTRPRVLVASEKFTFLISPSNGRGRRTLHKPKRFNQIGHCNCVIGCVRAIQVNSLSLFSFL